jgi:hypothetical protein
MATVTGKQNNRANAGAVKEVGDRSDDIWESIDNTEVSTMEQEPGASSQLEALYKGNVKVQSTTEHFSARAKKRALEVIDLHESVGHPCDAVLGAALDAGCYAGTDLTSADLRVARLVYGPCDACTEGKMTAPREPTSTSFRDSGVAHTVYWDVLPLLTTTIGGNTHAMVGCESATGYVMTVMQKGKERDACLKSVKKGIAEMNQYGHRVRCMVFDDEAVLKSMFDELRELGIVPSTYPAGMKNKTIERKIRELKEKVRCMKASLKFVLPTKLRGEMLMAGAIAINSVPNRKTGSGLTPYQIVTGRKVTPQPHKFGQVGLVNSRRDDDPDLRAEHGIFLYCMYGLHGHMKVYVPSRKMIYSKRTFARTRQYPAEWLLQRRLVDIRVDDGAMQAIDHTKYDESHRVMSNNDRSQLGGLLEYELQNQKPSESSRVMLKDEMVEQVTSKRLDDPIEHKPAPEETTATTPEEIPSPMVPNSPAKIPRLLMNIASDLKEVVTGPRARAPPKFYGKTADLKTQRKINRIFELNVQRRRRSDMREEKRMRAMKEATLLSNFTPGELYQLPCKAREVMNAHTARGLVEEAKQMDGESADEWDKRLEAMENRLVQRAFL